MASVIFRFLGSPTIEVDGVVTNRFRWSKLPAFFAYLFLFPGEQTREAIADALWPDRPPENARQNLRQTLLYADQLLAPNTEEVLQISRRTLALRRTAVSSDIDPFLRQASPGLDRGGRARCLSLVENYAGPLLPGIEDEWAVGARRQIARIYQEALVFLAKDLLATDPGQSLAYAETAIAEDMFDDPARAAKIEALVAVGREPAAKQEFAAYAALLQDELGMQPGRIVAEALREKPVRAPEEPAAPEPVDPRTEAVAEAVQFLRNQGMYKEAADLAVALVPVWIGMGTPAFGQKVLADAFREMRRPVGVFEKLSLAKLSHAEGDSVQSRSYCTEVVADAHPAEAVAEAHLLLARLDLQEVKPADALANALTSLRILRKLGNRPLQFEAWHCVAMARFTSGQFARVVSPARHAEQLREFVQNADGLQGLKLFRAFALLRLGRAAEAGRLAEEISTESMAGATPGGYRYKGTLGRLFEELGRREMARRLYEEAVCESRTRGNIFVLNVGLTYLGDLEFEVGNLDESLQHHFLALKSRRELKQNLGIATSLRGIGRALLRKGHANEARLSLQESTQRFRDDNALSGYASSQLLLAQAEFEAGDRRLARRLAQNSVEILRAMTVPNRLTIGLWGERILDQGEELLRRIG